jgi:hypothetical protein
MEGEMVDFQYRVAMDTYEQMNGKLKTPPVVYEPVDVPARPGLLRRLLRAVRAWRLGRVALQRTGAVARSQ